MNNSRINVLLWLMGTLYFLLGLNTLLGFFLAEKDLMFAIMLMVNAAIYLFGLLENPENLNRRAAHLLVGSFFSFLISLFKIFILIGLWLSGIVENMCMLSIPVANILVIFSGIVASFIYAATRKLFD